MHESVMTWAASVIRPEMVNGKDVLEVGAFDVNGSVRQLVEAMGPASYIGTDIRPGPGVDKVCDASDLPEMVADLVVSTEMLEHAEHWRPALAGTAMALRPHGYLLLTTRGPGFGRHDHPGDYWRFTCPLLAEVLIVDLGFDLLEVKADPDHPGVFALAKRWSTRSRSVDRTHQAIMVGTHMSG